MNTKPRSEKLYLARPIALRLTDRERTQVKKLAAGDGRSAAGFARQMYLRGLAAYLAETRTAA